MKNASPGLRESRLHPPVRYSRNLGQTFCASQCNRQHWICCSSQRAFICNFREHWLTIRRLGAQWFNLNSLLTGPELISDTFLALTLAQLQRDGYSIYLVVGELPDCQVSLPLNLVSDRAFHFFTNFFTYTVHVVSYTENIQLTITLSQGVAWYMNMSFKCWG